MAPKTAPEPKRRKINPPPSRRTVSSLTEEKASDATTSTRSHLPVVLVPQPNEINSRIQQAKNFAVSQAQQDGSTGNFKIFDSPFGNFLVPVIPTRAELAG